MSSIPRINDRYYFIDQHAPISMVLEHVGIPIASVSDFLLVYHICARGKAWQPFVMPNFVAESTPPPERKNLS